MKYGVILTRAQPIHKGHIDTIKEALKENDKVLLIIGSSNKRGTERNPISIDIREHIVRNALKDCALEDHVDILTLPDWSTEKAYQYAKEWGNFFYYNVVRMIERKEFTMYYNDDVSIVKNWFNDVLKERVTVKQTGRKRDVSATKIREALRNQNDTYLKEMLCESTYAIKDILRDMLMNCKNEDFIMP